MPSSHNPDDIYVTKIREARMSFNENIELKTQKELRKIKKLSNSMRQDDFELLDNFNSSSSDECDSDEEEDSNQNSNI